MTPTATYIAEENCLQELPRMDEPSVHFESCEIGSLSRDYWFSAWQDYNAHLATLRKIPCHDSCRGLWVEGQLLEEGKDYEVRAYEMTHAPEADWDDFPTDYGYTAFPLVPVKSEDDDRWEEAFLKLRKKGYNPAELEMHITELKKDYTLTKKQ